MFDMGNMRKSPIEKERRKKLRYRLQLPVIFRWHNGRTHTDGGFTRDLSAQAIYLISAAKPPLRALLRLQIMLPGSGKDPGNPILASGR